MMYRKPFLKDKGTQRTTPKHKPAVKPLKGHAKGWFPAPVAATTKPAVAVKPSPVLSPAAIDALAIVRRQPVYFDGRYWTDYFMQSVSYIPQSTIAELRRFKAVRMVGGQIVERERKPSRHSTIPAPPITDSARLIAAASNVPTRAVA